MSWLNGKTVTHFQYLASSCGWVADGWQSSLQKRGLLEAESEQIAHKLESVGICTRNDSQGLYVVGDLSGCCEPLDAGYRHINLIPVVAQRERKEITNELRYFLDNARGRVPRYAVITSGQRIPFFGDFKGVRAKHTRRISKWASESVAKGVAIVFRSDEVTFRRSDVQGMDGCHLHSNVVYYPLRRLTKQEWADWLAWSHKKLGAHWQDCGKLKDVREVVKYICKLSYVSGSDDLKAGFVGLNQLSAEELGWLYDETYRAKLVQPLGQFAHFKRYLEQSGERVRSIRLKSGRIDLARVKRSEKQQKPNNLGLRTENQILGRLAPSPRFSALFETCTIVRNYEPNTCTGMGRVGLEIMEANSRQARRWEEKNRSRWGKALNVHTITPTVQKEKTTKPAHDTDTRKDMEEQAKLLSIPEQKRKATHTNRTNRTKASAEREPRSARSVLLRLEEQAEARATHEQQARELAYAEAYAKAKGCTVGWLVGSRV